MQVTDYVAGSCAAAGISNLGSHKNAFDAMVGFCKATLGQPNKNRYSVNSGPPRYAKLNTHYVFIAGPEGKPGEKNRSHHSKAWVAYGTEFAQYILDHRLGVLSTCGQYLNLKYHATTTCQVWVWHPNQKALEAWWTKANGKLADVIAAEKAKIGEKVKVALAKYEETKTGLLTVAHHGYGAILGKAAAEVKEKVVTIHQVSYPYLYFYQDNADYYVYWSTKDPKAFTPGDYYIVEADLYNYKVLRVGDAGNAALASQGYVEPPLPGEKVEVPTKKSAGMKRKWKMVLASDGTKKRKYYTVKATGEIPQAYTLGSAEPVKQEVA